MSYGKDLRKRVLDFIASGGSKPEAAKRYQIHLSTVYVWLKQPSKTRNTPSRRYDREELARYISANPDKLLKEIASHFNASINTIHNSLKRMNIVRKKRHSTTKKAPHTNLPVGAT